jgi:HSP20 family protein
MAQGWESIRDLTALQERMNRLFEETARRSNDDSGQERDMESADWHPAADIHENERGFRIALDLPGIDREALEISLENDSLAVRGIRSIEKENHSRLERPRGRFVRRFTLPAAVDQNSISADYKDGVLYVHLPRREEQKSRRIEIKVS